MIKSAEKINERLINEYISKVECCDECFASVYCTVNGLRESRVPQDYCVNNIKRYFGDNGGGFIAEYEKAIDEKLQGEWRRGFIFALDKAFSEFDSNCTYSGDRVLQKLEKLKEEVIKNE